MIASTKHKFIFIHIPKTAGGSIKHALNQAVDIDIHSHKWVKFSKRK